MALTLIFLLITLAPLVLARVLRSDIAILFVAAALGFGLCAIAVTASGAANRMDAVFIANETVRDITSGLPWMTLMQISGLLLVCGAITWLQERLNAMHTPTLSRVSFWGLYLGLLVPVFSAVFLVLVAATQEYLHAPGFKDGLRLIYFTATYLSYAALVSLAGLLLYSITRHFRRRATH